MRWYKPEIVVEDQKRYIKRFLFFPRTIGNETRWLECVTITQVAYYECNLLYWKDIAFGKYTGEFTLK